jgi:aminopeptidase N
MKVSSLFQVFLLTGLVACGSGSPAGGDIQSTAKPLPPAGEQVSNDARATRDPYSYANSEQMRVRHAELNLTVDFATQTLTGQVTLVVERLNDQAGELVLDTRGLDIRRVALNQGGAKLLDLPWRLGEADPVLGAPLLVDVSAAGRRGRFSITVDYTTRPGAEALQWLDKGMTSDGRSPFLYSVAASIHARSWIPLQDTAATRMTFGARLRVPPGLTALMSARTLSADIQTGEYTFSMSQEIPAYLIAIAVGELKYHAFDQRSGVWAEPSVIEAAAEEFEDTPAMIAGAEALYGPYRWEQYDLLVLPPAFSLGGMEHPRLSFITPTLIAGDKSLVGTVVHELAHSWSGNLVTNASWQHMWLNEGFTSYVEMRVVETLYGKAERKMEEVLGYQDLMFELAELAPENQSLVPAVLLKNPDDGFTAVPYQKGAQFLVYLEQAYGREAFDAFLKQYFDHFAFQSVTTEDFLDYLQQHLASVYPGRVSASQLERWIYAPGMPADFVPPVSPELEEIRVVILDWLDGEIELVDIPRSNWGSQQWRYLLGHLPVGTDPGQLAVLDDRFKLTDSGNAIVTSKWLELAVRMGYQPAYRRLEPFLIQVGRSSLINNVYRALAESSPQGLELARDIYRKAGPGYHPTARPSIQALLYPGDRAED